MSYIQRNRMKIETEVLKKYFPKFRWIPEDDPESLEVELTTNSGKRYQLTLYLPSDYPNSQPEMVVSRPRPLRAYSEAGECESDLEDYDDEEDYDDDDYDDDYDDYDDEDEESNPLLSTSGSMHTLGGVKGCVQICHYSSSNWSPNVTLYKVILKGRLWLEAYEIYLRTGNDIDTYLPHQQ
jgi:hypothetical protein